MPGRALPSVIASLVAVSALAQSTPPADDARPAAPPPTRTIYVPYKDLAQALGGEIPGVYLPYDEFLELWGRTYPEAPVPPPPPPGESAIGDVAIEGVVAGDSVAWKAALEVTTRARGWSEVPIAFAGAAIEKFEVVGAPEAIVRPLDGGGYALLVPRAGTYSARLELATAVTGEGDARLASLAAPRAAIARARLTIDETRVRPSIERALAAAVEEADGKTSVLGLLPAGGPVVVRWNRQPAEFDPGREGYLFTTVAAASTIAAEVERLSARVEGRVMRAALRSVRIRLPDGFTLLAASGDGVTGATPEADGRLLVSFERPRDAFDIALRLERPRPAGEREVVLAAPSVEAATRETTFLAAAPAGDLRARLVAAERAERVEPADWPGDESARPPGSLLFRRLAPDARVALAVEEASPRVAAALDERLEIAGAGARLLARAKLDVTDAGLFDVRFDAPAGWTVEDVGPKEIVRERRVEEIAGRLAITASLRARAKGSVTLDVALRRDGDPVAAPIAAPIVRVTGAEREDLVLSVAVEDALNVKVASVAGLDPVDAASLPGDRLPPPAHPETMAFRSSGRSAELTLAAERRTARVVATTRASIAVEEDRLALRSTIVFNVQYAARDSFTLLVPEAIEPTLDVAAPRLKERTRVGPSAARPGFAEWRVTLQAPMTGDVAISVAGEAPLRRPATGAAATVDAPLVFAAGVERETGHVALSRASNLEIEPRAEALEPIDPRELPAELAGDGAVLAWRYVAAPASLRLEVKRHDYQPVIDSAVTHLHVDTVVSASGLCRSVALLEARNTARQYLETLLPEGSTLLAAEVNGSSVRPNKRPGEPALLVPIPLTEAGGAPAGVRLLYETRLGDDAPTGIFGRVTVEAPRFAGVPVLRTTIRAYLPEDLVPLAYGGGARALADRGDFLAWTSSCPTLSRLGFLAHPAVLAAEAAARPAPRPAGDAAGGGSYALDLDIAREGREHLFATLDGNALASVTWASAGFFSVLRALAFALPIALGVLLVRKRRVPATPYVLLSALLLALLAPLAPAGLLALLDAALFGVAAFALATMALAVIAFLRTNAKSYESTPARPEGGAA